MNNIEKLKNKKTVPLLFPWRNFPFFLLQQLCSCWFQLSSSVRHCYCCVFFLFLWFFESLYYKWKQGTQESSQYSTTLLASRCCPRKQKGSKDTKWLNADMILLGQLNFILSFIIPNYYFDFFLFQYLFKPLSKIFG